MSQHLFRHLLATISYRANLAITDAPSHYPTFSAGKGVRPPIKILNHMSNVLAYALHYYRQTPFEKREPGDWANEVDYFYKTLEEFDRLLAEGKTPTGATVEQILQGPLADALTHVGQLSMLRRLADAPVERRNFMKAEIQTGKFRL
jgi:hypothetical protein